MMERLSSLGYVAASGARAGRPDSGPGPQDRIALLPLAVRDRDEPDVQWDAAESDSRPGPVWTRGRRSSPRMGGRRASGPGSARNLGAAACLPVRVFRLFQKRAHVGVFGKQLQVFLHRFKCVVMRVDSNAQRRERAVQPG